MHLINDRIPENFHFLILEGPLLHDLTGPELALTMYQLNLRRKPSEECRLFNRGIPTTDNDQLLITKEEAVTGCAGGDASTEVLFFSESPRYLADAPVAMITASAVRADPSSSQT